VPRRGGVRFIMPIVSAVIPTHSRTSMLKEAAHSVLNQSFSDLELIIAASSPTPECREMARFLEDSDPRCRLVEIEKDSLAAARNAGIEAAKGEWIAFLDDDDVWFANKIERQLSVNADMVNCDFIEQGGALDGVMRRVRPPKDLSIAEGFVLGNYGAASASGAMVKTNIIRELGGFDERLDGCEDWDMWRRISWHHKVIFMDEPLLFVSRHPGAMQAKAPRFFHPKHFIKTMGDTPPHLRHMLLQLIFRGIYLFAYGALNRTTRGRFRSTYKRIAGYWN
jgi:glycosyltransferase involved in cell wall biosynthesis